MLALSFFIGVIGAIWCAVVASNKNISVLGYTVLGFVLPLLGVILVHVAKPALELEP